MFVAQSATQNRNSTAQAQCAPRKASWFYNFPQLFSFFFFSATLKTTVDCEQHAVHHLITMPCFLGNPCVVTCAQMPLDTNHPPAHTCRSTAAVIDVSCQRAKSLHCCLSLFPSVQQMLIFCKDSSLGRAFFTRKKPFIVTFSTLYVFSFKNDLHELCVQLNFSVWF